MNEEIENILNREEMSLASTQKRGFAFFIDELLLSFLLIFSFWDSFATAPNIEAIINLTNSFVLEYIALKIAYQAFFTMQYGASLGKIVMKIRIIEIKTLRNPNVLASLNRSTIRVLSEMLFYLGFLWGFFDPLKQTWHDKSAKTLVVNG